MKKLLQISLCTASLLFLTSSTHAMESMDRNKSADLETFMQTGKCYRCDLSGLDLRESIQSLRARGITPYLKQANLSGANLAGTNLSGVQLREAILTDADLEGANLSGAHLPKAHLIRTNLTNANLHNALCRGTIFDATILTNTNLTGTHLNKAQLINLDPFIDLSAADFTQKVKSEEPQDKQESFYKFLQTGQCDKCDLSGLDLREAIQTLRSQGKTIYLKQADVSGSNLSNVDLSGAHFRKAKLVDTNLENSNLQNANLPGTDLTNANLINANLKGAVLRNAIVTGALFNGADLTGAGMRGVNFSTAADTSGAQGIKK
jgi:uncharacterized protein YjbI with pentapeptide repeats